MQQIQVPYGKTYQTAQLPDSIPLQVIAPESAPVEKTVQELIESALDHPIGTPKLEEMVKKEDRILILVNDQTRPGPNCQMVQAVLERLRKAGIKDERNTFMVATGSHRPPKEEELRELLGEKIVSSMNVKIHDCQKNCVYIGTTTHGLPLYVDEEAAKSTFIIATGLIMPHKAAGFSGGRKSIVPGIAGIETLKIHHSLPIRPYEPAIGQIEGNPFHQSALEAARLVNLKFILNAVQDTAKQNVAMVAGDMEKAHARGVKICRQFNTVHCHQHADLLIVSPGGAPRDCNLYQSQKALATAEVFAAADSEVTMILTARAEDGIGPEKFQQWLARADTPDQVIDRFRREGFDVGTNKAFEYARAMKKGEIIIVSDSEKVDPVRLKQMGLKWTPTLQRAIDMVLEKRTPRQAMVIPKATSIIPDFGAEKDERISQLE